MADYDAIPLTNLFSAPKIGKALSSADPYTAKENKNVTTVEISKLIAADTEAAAAVTAEIERTKVRHRNEAIAREIELRQAAQDVFTETENNLTGIRRRDAESEAAYQRLNMEQEELAKNGNHSFFRNPLSYVVTQYKMDYKDEQMQKIRNAINANSYAVDNEYAKAVQELQTLRSQSYANDLAAAEMMNNDEMLALSIKLGGIESHYKGLATLQSLSQQRGERSVTEDLQAKEMRRIQADEKRKAMYQYTLMRGSVKGFNETLHTKEYSAMFERQPPEAKARHSRALSKFSQSVDANTPLDAKELVRYAQVTGDSDTLITVLSSSDIPGAQRVTAAVQQAQGEVVGKRFAALQEAWLADPANKKKFVASGSKLPDDAAKQLYTQAVQDTLSGAGQDVMQHVISMATSRAAQAASLDARGTIAAIAASSAGLLELQESLQLTPASPEMAYFRSDKYRKLVTLEIPEYQQDMEILGSDWGAFSAQMMNDMVNAGVPPERAARAAAAHNSLAVRVRARQDPQGGSMYKELEGLGIKAVAGIQVPLLPTRDSMWSKITGEAYTYEGLRGRTAYVNNPDDILLAWNISQSEAAKAQARRAAMTSPLSTSSQIVTGSLLGIPIMPVNPTGIYAQDLKAKAEERRKQNPQSGDKK